VASVIDAYLDHAKHDLDAATHVRRTQYLQMFAEAHGFRLVKECLPIHLTQWLDGKSAWESDWTRATVIKIVQRAFNWGARQRLIPSNPFFGVTQRPGEPRRPMTDEEFRKLIRATVKRLPEGHKRRNSPKRPTAGTRFRQRCNHLDIRFPKLFVVPIRHVAAKKAAALAQRRPITPLLNLLFTTTPHTAKTNKLIFVPKGLAARNPHHHVGVKYDKIPAGSSNTGELGLIFFLRMCLCYVRG
jgi:hypothetical protein